MSKNIEDKVSEINGVHARHSRELDGFQVRRAVREGFKADYLMFDSWHTCAEWITLCRSLARGTMPVLGMVKDGKRKYLLSGNRRILVERLLELFEDMLRTVATAVGRGGSATLADIFTAPEYDACMQGLFGQFLQNGGFAPCKKAA